MEKIKEKYLKINGRTYSLELCGQKQFDMKTIPGLLRELELIVAGAEDYKETRGIVRDIYSKKNKGKFIEATVKSENVEYHYLNILLTDKPKKVVKISEAIQEENTVGFFHRFKQIAFQKNNGLFSGWSNVDLEEIPITYQFPIHN